MNSLLQFVVNAMREWLSEYTIKVETEQPPQADPTETALNLIRQQLPQRHSAFSTATRIFPLQRKNSLWKIVLEKITVFRTPEGEFSLHLYPKLPR